MRDCAGQLGKTTRWFNTKSESHDRHQSRGTDTLVRKGPLVQVQAGPPTTTTSRQPHQCAQLTRRPPPALATAARFPTKGERWRIFPICVTVFPVLGYGGPPYELMITQEGCNDYGG